MDKASLEQRLGLPRDISIIISLNKDGSTKVFSLSYEAQKNHDLTKSQKKELRLLMASGADEVHYGNWLYKKVEDCAGITQDSKYGRLTERTIRYIAHVAL